MRGTFVSDKENVPNLITNLNQTPTFEHYVTRCGSKNGLKKDMCLKKIELRAQNMTAILGSIINIIGDLYDHLMSTRIFTLIMYEILTHGESSNGLNLDFVTHLVLISCVSYASYEKLASWKSNHLRLIYLKNSLSPWTPSGTSLYNLHRLSRLAHVTIWSYVMQ